MFLKFKVQILLLIRAFSLFNHLKRLQICDCLQKLSSQVCQNATLIYQREQGLFLSFTWLFQGALHPHKQHNTCLKSQVKTRRPMETQDCKFSQERQFSSPLKSQLYSFRKCFQSLLGLLWNWNQNPQMQTLQENMDSKPPSSKYFCDLVRSLLLLRFLHPSMLLIQCHQQLKANDFKARGNSLRQQILLCEFEIKVKLRAFKYQIYRH